MEPKKTVSLWVAATGRGRRLSSDGRPPPTLRRSRGPSKLLSHGYGSDLTLLRLWHLWAERSKRNRWLGHAHDARASHVVLAGHQAGRTSSSSSGTLSCIGPSHCGSQAFLTTSSCWTCTSFSSPERICWHLRPWLSHMLSHAVVWLLGCE